MTRVHAADFDVAVIGAGILGCTMARVLSRYKLDVCVLDAAHDVAEGATKANSGLIQSGFHARAHSLKGTSCVAGNMAYTRIAEELDVPFQRIGALYVAFSPVGMDKVREKYERGIANGADDLYLVSGAEARAMEPRLSGKVLGAMVAPSTGIISPFELCLATARNAAANGVAFTFGFHVDAVERVGGIWQLTAADGRRVTARYVVNMAGEEAALVDAQVHPADLVVRPRRGQFVVFDKQDASSGVAPIRHVLFQAADDDEGGTLLAPTVDDNLLAGPTSENVRTFADNATTQAGIEHVKRVARKIVPDLDTSTVITAFAGIRANIVNVEKEKKDFVVRLSAPGFVSALGIKNPGMTSAPALVDIALSLLEGDGLALEEDPSYDARTQGAGHLKPFMQCTPEEQERLLAQDPRFGHVVCRCEKVTEGDVRAVLHDVLPPTTIDGVKRRLRVSMGRCQGGFCLPRVQAIMADELGASPHDICKGEDNGRLVKGRVK